MGTPLAHQPPATVLLCRLSFPTPTQSADPLVTGGAKFATPTPTRDGVTRSWQLRA
jgi:hypothetical protein